MGFGGFSWKRATGLTKAKTRLSRAIGVPLTKGGRQRKFGAALGGSILGGVVASKSRRSRSARVDSDDYDDGTQEIPPHEKNPYGLPQSGAGFTCLMLVIMLLLPIIFFPIGILLSIALLVILLMRTHKQNNTAIKAIAMKVKKFTDKMNTITMPRIAVLTRGSPDKIELLEQLRENQIRVALAIAEVKPSERARLFVERLAACATMKELEDVEGGRIAMLVEMATDAGCQEAFYCIDGYYTGANSAVRQVLAAAATKPAAVAPLQPLG